jgi:hypothetical protein
MDALITLAVYWVAERYAELLAARRAGRYGLASALAWAGSAALLGGVVIVLEFRLH